MSNLQEIKRKAGPYQVRQEIPQTITPQLLYRIADHKYSRDTVRQFTVDAARALEMIKTGR